MSCDTFEPWKTEKLVSIVAFPKNDSRCLLCQCPNCDRWGISDDIDENPDYFMLLCNDYVSQPMIWCSCCSFMGVLDWDLKEAQQEKAICSTGEPISFDDVKQNFELKPEEVVERLGVDLSEGYDFLAIPMLKITKLLPLVNYKATKPLTVTEILKADMSNSFRKTCGLITSDKTNFIFFDGYSVFIDKTLGVPIESYNINKPKVPFDIKYHLDLSSMNVVEVGKDGKTHYVSFAGD